MPDLKLDDYRRWKELNGDRFSMFDYLRGSLISGESSPDIIVSFARLAFPDILEINGMFFIEDLFSKSKLDQLKLQGLSAAEIEYWMNLLAVSDIFASFPDAFAADLILKIKSSWECRLNLLYPGKFFEVIISEDDGDTYLSLRRRIGLPTQPN